MTTPRTKKMKDTLKAHADDNSEYIIHSGESKPLFNLHFIGLSNLPGLLIFRLIIHHAKVN